MVEKLIRDGKVAVLISPGFGAGWSTWASEHAWSTWASEHAEFALFDKGLVELAERGATTDEVETYLASKDMDFYKGGWRDVEIRWLDQGTRFTVEEYDGSESLRMIEDLAFTA